MTRHNSEYLKSQCPNCGKEVIVTKRQKNHQCQTCYNKTHSKKVYWKGGDNDEDQFGLFEESDE